MSSVLFAGCSNAEPLEVAVEASEASEPSTTTAVSPTPPTTIEPLPESLIDNPTDGWRIGVEYTGTRLLAGDVELDPASVMATFGGSRSLYVQAAGCGAGSGTFVWDDGQVRDWERAHDLMLCTPSDVDVEQAAGELLSSSFEMSSDGPTLVVATDRFRLELSTGLPSEEILLADTERFVGIETDVPGIDPTRIQLESPAFFVLVATMPTCQIHGGLATEDGVSTVAFEPRPGFDPCEFSPEEDLTARSFLENNPTLTRDGSVVSVVGSAGSLTLQLADAAGQPITVENVPPPVLVNPVPPARPEPEAGRLSEPWFATRAVDEAGVFDIPVPPEWESQPGRASASVVGRGTFSADRSAQFDEASLLAGFEILDGPSPVTTRTYSTDGGEVVETGATLSGTHYWLSSRSSIIPPVVWVFPHQGSTVVMVVSFPDLPSSGEDPRNHILTGLDPVELLRDVRIFDE